MESREDLIIEAYRRISDGAKRCDIETEITKVTAYWAGDIIRIDIKILEKAE